ncbi:MAG: lipopolysaccharide biosynthesis protein [Thermoguttaceae bacterium]|jgi:O-antigen/teichoic acid export membrane protein
MSTVLTRTKTAGKPRPPQTEHSFAQKGAWAAAASGMNLLGRFVVQIVLARVLGLQGLGQFVYLSWIIEIGNLVFCVGLPNSLTRYSAELLGQHQPEQAAAFARWAYTRFVAAAMVGALVVGMVFCWHSQFVAGKAALPVMIALFLIRSLENINLAYLTGLQRFALLTRLQLASSAVQVAGVTLGASCWGWMGAMLGCIAGSLLPAVYSTSMLRGSAFDAKIAAPLRRRTWHYALNTWLAMLLSAVVWSRTEIFFIERYWGIRQVAIFSVGLTLATTVQQVVNLFSGAFLPHFAGLAGAGKHAVIQRHYEMATKLMAFVIIPASLGGAAISPVLVPMLFGANFVPAVPSAIVLVVTAALSFATIGSSLMYAMEKSGFIATWSAIGAVVSVTAAIIVVPSQGAWGAVWCRLVLQWSMIGLATWFITRRLRFSFPFQAVGRMMLAGLFCGAAAWCAVRANPNPVAALMVAVPLGAAVYVASVRALRVLNVEEQRRLLMFSERLPVPVRRLSQHLLQRVLAK